MDKLSLGVIANFQWHTPNYSPCHTGDQASRRTPSERPWMTSTRTDLGAPGQKLAARRSNRRWVECTADVSVASSENEMKRSSEKSNKDA